MGGQIYMHFEKWTSLKTQRVNLVNLPCNQTQEGGSTFPSTKKINLYIYVYGCFLIWWYPTTMAFPTKMIILGCFRSTTIKGNTYMFPCVPPYHLPWQHISDTHPRHSNDFRSPLLWRRRQRWSAKRWEAHRPKSNPFKERQVGRWIVTLRGVSQVVWRSFI